MKRTSRKQPAPPTLTRPQTRGDILRLAAASELDPRTVKRAVERGISSIRADVDRQRLVRAAEVLRMELPS